MADRYWVGGTTSWNGTAGTKWATTSGGAGGAAEPTVNDDVYFDANSGNVTVTATSGAGNCRNINFTGFTGTFNTGAMTLHIAGSFTLYSGMTIGPVVGGVLSFEATTTGHTIDFAGKVLDSVLTFNGVGGGWTLASALTLAGGVTTNQMTLTNGSFDANGFNVTVGRFSSNNSNVRTLTMGSGQWSISDGGVTVWTTATQTNLTFNKGSLPIKFTNSGSAARTITTGAFSEANAPAMWVSAGTGTVNSMLVTGGLDFTGFTGTLAAGNRTVYGDVTLGAGMVTAATTNNLTFAATSGLKTLTTNGVTVNFDVEIDGVGGAVQLGDDLLIVKERQLAILNGSFDANDFDVTVGNVNTNVATDRAISMGNGQWTVTGDSGTVWSMNSLTGMTFSRGPLPIRVEYSGDGSTVRNLRPGAFDTGTEASAPSFAVVNGNDTISAAGDFFDLDFTGFEGTLDGNARNMFGSLILDSSMTWEETTANTNFIGTAGTHVIDTKGLRTDADFLIDGVGGTWRLESNIEALGVSAINLNNGTLLLNGHDITCAFFLGGSDGDDPVCDFSGRTLTLVGTSDVDSVFGVDRSNTPDIDFTSATIIVTADAPATKRILNMGDQRIGRLELRGAGAGAFELRNSGNFSSETHIAIDELVIDGGSTVRFVGDLLYVIDGLIFENAGPEDFVDLGVLSGIEPWKIQKLTPGAIKNLDYARISNSRAMPDDVWYAGENSIDDGGNDGWIFDDYAPQGHGVGAGPRHELKTFARPITIRQYGDKVAFEHVAAGGLSLGGAADVEFIPKRRTHEAHTPGPVFTIGGRAGRAHNKTAVRDFLLKIV